ncbi:hypothetical protein SAMN04488109_4615 [Chryseolinea serpens]|uniref:Uncharacterized protein n=1 Tax=Chryseolinea serpens TaxID=947013 RepID=A0A1M5UDH5_9BACT|nr:hypothetical protein [Chryseolinea serpens]SHH61084.1 hypothetical protein SAMN04488109_4615 [Chryseolinea serpens]
MTVLTITLVKFLRICVFCLCTFDVFSQTTTTIPYDTLSSECLDRIKEETLVVDDPADYGKLEVLNDAFNCDPLPDIDFNTKLLIGYTMSVSGCLPPKWTARIEVHDKLYTINVDIQTYGICRRSFRNVAWMIIDKPQGPYEVKFNRYIHPH